GHDGRRAGSGAALRRRAAPRGQPDVAGMARERRVPRRARGFAAKPLTPARGRGSYFGGGSEQTWLMHVTPEAASQQSAVVLHLSPLCEQPIPVDVHIPFA